MRERTRFALSVVLVAAVVGVVVLHDADERTSVTFQDRNGTELATVDVAVADSAEERYTGLSDTESLGPNEGMLFVHGSNGDHAYVMRDMAFPIDIVFVAGNGTVTRVHHAQLDEDGRPYTRYPGYGKYVVELPYGFTNRTGIDAGDRLAVPEEHRNAEG